MRFPKIIHQIWYQGESELPVNYQKYSKTWKKMHPDFEYMLWDSESMETLIREYYPKYLELYKSYPKMIQKIDCAKYFIMHRFGGVYADIDMECLKPIDPLLKSSTTNLLVVDMGLDLFERISVGRLTEKLYNNSFFVSTRLNPVWKAVHVAMKQIILKKKWNESNFHYIFRTTGPDMFSKIITRFNSSYAPIIGVISHDLIDPIKWCDYNGPSSIDKTKIPNAYTVQHYGSKNVDKSISWTSNWEMFTGICLCQVKKLWWLVFLAIFLLLIQRTGVTKMQMS